MLASARLARAHFGAAERGGLKPMAIASKIRLESPHYVLRTVEAGDVSERWTQWMTDRGTARMLNARPRAATVDDIRKYLATFDGRNNHLLGIFEKDGGALVGFWAVFINWTLKEFTVNVLVGEVQARGKGAREETRDVMYPYFFEVLEMKAARCSVLAHNAPTLKVMQRDGWELTGISFKAPVDGGVPFELRDYRLPRETWARKRTS